MALSHQNTSIFPTDGVQRVDAGPDAGIGGKDAWVAGVDADGASVDTTTDTESADHQLTAAPSLKGGCSHVGDKPPPLSLVGLGFVLFAVLRGRRGPIR